MSQMIHSVCRTALFLTMVIGPASSFARDPSGTAIAVVQATEVKGDAGQMPLQTEDGVFMGDEISTGSKGEAQIIFRDQTRLVVGPNSAVTVDSFILATNETASKVGMSASKGFFRFISGLSQKQAYDLKTPSATIGVRGTEFDFFVAPTGETSIAMFKGEALVCDYFGHCIVLKAGCAVVVIGPNGGLTEVKSQEDKSALLAVAFPYVTSQASLRSDFRIDVSACPLRRASLDVELGTPPSASPH